MHTALIIANRTIGGEELAAAVRRRVADGGCTFHLLVPVASPVSSAVAFGSAAGDAANITPTASFEVVDENQIAREKLFDGLEWLRSLGAEASGELATECDTAAAVARAVLAHPVDEVIVSTLPSTISRWLRQDLPHRIERKVEVPVTVISGTV